MLNHIFFFCSENFAKSNRVEGITKAIFPYEKYHSIDEILCSGTFPPYSDFKTTLGTSNQENLKTFLEIMNEKVKNGVISTIR